MRGSDGDATQQAARGRFGGRAGLVLRVILIRGMRRMIPISEIFAVIGSFDRQLVAVGAAADGEAFGLMGKYRAVGGGVRHMDGDHAPGGGFGVRVRPAGQADLLASVTQQLMFGHLQFDEMVEMDRIEQAFDDRVAVDAHRAERRVDRRPCRADQRVGGDTRSVKIPRHNPGGRSLMVDAEIRG